MTNLFGAIVRTVVNTAVLPIAMVQDVLTLGGALCNDEPAVKKQLEKIKREATKADDE